MIPIKDSHHITIKVAFWICTGCGTGLSKKAPGTLGSLLALLIYYLITLLFPQLNLITKITLVLFITFAGYLSIEICRQNLDEFSIKDPQLIVIDEIAGYFTAVLFCAPTILNLLLAFIFFRVFDITKPLLVGWADNQEGSFAIILDDLIAGLLASLLVFAINLIIF